MKFDLDKLKSGLQVGYGIAFLLLVVWVSPEIKAAAQMLVARFDRAAALEVAGFKVTFTDSSIGRGLEVVNFKLNDSSERSEVLKAIRALDSDKFIRLMTIGATSSSCEYEIPEPKMRSDVALDYELAARGLAKIETSPTVLADAREERRKTLAQGADLWTIGEPRTCYTMTLTKLGNDAKSAIVTNLAPAFDGLGPGVAPDERPKDVPKVTAMN